MAVSIAYSTPSVSAFLIAGLSFAVLAASFASLCACGGGEAPAQPPARPHQTSGKNDMDPPPRAPVSPNTTLTVGNAKDIVARVDPRRPKVCGVACDGAAKAVRLKLQDERDYRLVLLSKQVTDRDTFHISNAARDTSLTMIESTDVGAVISLRGADSLKVCSKPKMQAAECEFDCAYDPATNIVKMTAGTLSAELAVLCY